MSSDQIELRPQEFDAEISKHDSANKELSSIKYSTDKKTLKLSSTDSFVDSIRELNSAISEFNSMVNDDVYNLKLIKSQVLKLDGDISNTFEKITSLITGK